MFKIIGALGLILISAGILNKTRKLQDILYVVGGVFLEIYSLHLKDIIFIVLQIVFTIAAIYDLYKVSHEKRTAK